MKNLFIRKYPAAFVGSINIKIALLLILIPVFSFSQEKLKGMIMEVNEESKHVPVAGANVYWLNTTVGAITDFEGTFTIPYKPEYKKNMW